MNLVGKQSIRRERSGGGHALLMQPPKAAHGVSLVIAAATSKPERKSTKVDAAYICRVASCFLPCQLVDQGNDVKALEFDLAQSTSADRVARKQASLTARVLRNLNV